MAIIEIQPYHVYFYQKWDDTSPFYHAGSFSTMIKAHEAQDQMFELAGGENEGLRSCISQQRLDSWDKAEVKGNLLRLKDT